MILFLKESFEALSTTATIRLDRSLVKSAYYNDIIEIRNGLANTSTLVKHEETRSR